MALEKNCIAGLDDRMARRKARNLGIKIIGTLSILRRAYDERLITEEKLIESLQELRKMGFRISKEIIDELLEKLRKGHD
ncbi:MAG: DUF3368 domain-containing protein [Candidatus Baldrarchaeia archaeon]